jgi:hypothetical protein
MAAFVTSYIPTTTAAATRAADVAVMTGANFSNWYNQTEGTVFAESQLGSTFVSTRSAFDISDNSTNNRIVYRPAWVGGGIQTVIRSGGSLSADINSVRALNTSPSKAAIAYKVNDFQFTVNGTSVGSDTLGPVPSGVNQIFIGFVPGPGEWLNGHIRRLAFFPRRLADAELTALTS